MIYLRYMKKILLTVLVLAIVAPMAFLAAGCSENADEHMPITVLGWSYADAAAHGLSQGVGSTSDYGVLERWSQIRVGGSIDLRGFIFVNEGANFNELSFAIVYPPDVPASSMVRDGSVITAYAATSNIVEVRVSGAGRLITIRFMGIGA